MPTLQVSDAERKARSRIKLAANVTLLVGAASVMIGVLSTRLDPGLLDRTGLVNLSVGVIMLALSLFVRRRTQAIADGKQV